MECLLYNEELGEFRVIDDFDLDRLRILAEDPSDDPDYLEEFDEMEKGGWVRATSLTVAMASGEVHDEESLAAWSRRRKDEASLPSEPTSKIPDLSMLLLQEVNRLATSNERVATSMETIANHAHLLSPPMTVEQVAEYAHVKPKTIYDWKAKGWITPLADNAKPLLFDRDEVRRAVKRVRGIG
jgi:hypothetical protein